MNTYYAINCDWAGDVHVVVVEAADSSEAFDKARELVVHLGMYSARLLQGSIRLAAVTDLLSTRAVAGKM